MKFLQTVVLLFSVSSISTWILDNSKPQCGILYATPNFNTTEIQGILIKSSQILTDLSEFSLLGPKPASSSSSSKGSEETWDKKLSSLKLFSGCKIRVCDGAYLNGNCAWFNSTMTDIDSNWKNQVSSIACNCSIKNCLKEDCSSVQVRKTECARAYLEPKCQMCNGKFILMKRNFEQPHFGGFEDQVKSLVVGRGCRVTLYKEENYEEEMGILFGGAYDDLDGIGSYKCDCALNVNTNRVVDSPISTRSQNPHDPPLLNIPKSAEEIRTLLQQYPKHPGLEAALTSMRHKRSPMNAYILLIGLTGSGKSTSINFLFDNATICEVGSETSTTSAIHEYRIPVQVDELGCKNCELRVIDTPGFGDTSGMESDAKFLAGLETYLNIHPELRNRIPSVVLIFSRFNDNRIKGKSSSFVKTLRGIDLFKDRLFDFKYSNAITVLTHFMAATLRVQKNPSAKLREYRRTIEDYTTFPKPVTLAVAENKPEDNDKVLVNGYYLLPNGEYYPQNLFEKIQTVTENGHDPIGEAIIRTAFKFPGNFKITEKMFPLKNQSFPRETFFLGELNANNFNIEMTEISNLTAQVYEKQISQNLKDLYPGNLEYVQRVLNLRNIFTISNIPRTTVAILKLFKSLKQNELVTQLLGKALGVEVPIFDIPLITGQCYDVIKDTVLPITPFLIKSTYISETGFKLPTTVSTILTQKIEDIFYVYDTKSEYMKARHNMLKVGGNVEAASENAALPHGFNIKGSFTSSIDPNRRTLTAAREYRTFQLTLNNGLKFTQEFTDRVTSIPKFDSGNYAVVNDWKHFFSTYGTHVVSSAFGGGAIRVDFKVTNNSLPDSEALVAIKTAMENYFQFLEGIYMGNTPTLDNDPQSVSYFLNFLGGDHKFVVHDFSSQTIDQISTLLEGFQQSLEYQPAMLQTEMSLIPLSVVVQQSGLGDEISYKISNATAAFLNATLTYVPPPPLPPPMERPEVKKYIADLKNSLQANIDQLTTGLTASRESFENFTKTLIKQNELEREAMKKQLEKERQTVLTTVGLTCVYEQTDFKGNRLCTAEPQYCVSMTMKSAGSINTHNSCVKIFPGRHCSGTFHKHVSNQTFNSNFPFALDYRRTFSLLDCNQSNDPPITILKTLIVILLDDSGSMYSQKDNAIKGFNAFIKAQVQIMADEASVSLIKFHTTVSEVYSNVHIAKVPLLAFNPNGGSTALYDAIGEGVRLTERVEAAFDRIVFVIMTDGDDNASKKINKNEVGPIMRTKERQGKWTFLYIGLNPADWAKLTGMNIKNTATFNAAAQGQNFERLNTGILNFRTQSNLQLPNAFS